MASLSIKVYQYPERKTYWTFFLEETLKVGTVLGTLADKLLTKNLTLFVRTKSRLGRHIDKVLKPSDSLYELSEKYRKKKKPYELMATKNLSKVFYFGPQAKEEVWEDFLVHTTPVCTFCE
eukprot:Phypoly_transcript_25057.p1 GENE.Phypoly_transcript_25057~~Phypoly_transcript_25057.p1  ORF type:complete len:121 (+),score=7.48 Phypoly_transcript_25057:127-489(+)